MKLFFIFLFLSFQFSSVQSFAFPTQVLRLKTGNRDCSQKIQIRKMGEDYELRYEFGRPEVFTHVNDGRICQREDRGGRLFKPMRCTETQYENKNGLDRIWQGTCHNDLGLRCKPDVRQIDVVERAAGEVLVRAQHRYSDESPTVIQCLYGI